MNNSPLKLYLNVVVANGLKYTLAGNTRTGTGTAAANVPCTAIDAKRCIPDEEITFNKGQVLKFRRARLIPDAPGLLPGSALLAGELGVIQGIKSGSTITKNAGTDAVPLKFVKFDEWEDKDLEIKFTEDGSALGLATGSKVSVTDFNVQDDWVGQVVKFAIEAEAEVYPGE